ncbi:hypothetical protein [Stutzerimonas nitrititolerans]|uniref:hypothetical protein n=2 Tax=Stutzerimonas nitrititolerans TaxID=2482751 RepID=UPI0028A020B4|nr:hypothetical protein [Stutzerimonas nitrititolerans]
MRTVNTTILALLFFFCHLSHAQENSEQTNQVSPPMQSASSNNTELDLAKQQIKLLESQLQTTREYQGLLLDTVYWALGGIFVLVGLLLGFGWFANFKVYERDKESMRLELTSEISNISRNMEGELRKIESELNTALDTKFNTSNINLATQLKSQLEEAIAPIKASISSAEDRIFQLQLNHRKERMESEASDSMALTKALHVLQLCVYKATDEIPDILNFMLKKLERGGKFTATEITNVNELIDKLPKQYQTLTDRLRTKLVASDIF